MITSRQLTAGGVSALITPFAIATGGWGVVPIAILSGLALVYAPPSAPHKGDGNTEKRQADLALVETADFDPQSGGEYDNIDNIGYSPHFKSIIENQRLEACRQAYDMGITNVDDVLKYIRDTVGSREPHSDKNRKWVKSNFLAWRFGTGNIHL
jgi:hypothetical protein